MIVDIVQDELKKLAHILDPHPSSKPADHVAIHSRSAFTKSHAVTLTSLDVTEIQETLKAVLSTVQNNRNINNFMMMTINRCIDYTKASRGLKLVPKYETVDLLDTLFLPFKCMGDVSQKVRISLEPLSSAICSHVITDKQWLQENVLCLLSNAVKYSAGGTVNGRMILTTAEAVGPSARCHIISTLDRSVSDDSMHSITTGALSANILDVASNSHASRSIRGRQVRSAVSPAINEDMEELDTPQGVAEMRKLELEHAQQVLLVEIEDTGIGMADEAMANLFDAFKRAQKFAGGTGLGLFSLAKRIEALGGSYGVRRRENGMQGSLFWFTIPYRPDEQFATLVRESSAFRDIETRRRDMQLILEEVSSKVPVTLPLSQNASAVSPLNLSNLLSLSDSSSNKGLKILIVDDSASIQKMMSMMLRRHGHVVDQAENGAIAVSLVNAAYQDSRTKMLERLTEAQRGSGKERVIGWQELMHTPYDVVLMDLQMPVMDGLEAMERIRKVEKELIVDITRICADTLVDALFDADEITLFEREPDWGDEVKVEEEGQARSAGMKGSHENRGSLHLDFNNSNHTKHAPPKQLISKLSNQRLSSCQLEDIQVMLARSCHQLVLGVSANSDTDTMQDALSAGADAFISKPFSIDSFYATYNKCFHITNRVYKQQ
ncbi:response regulator [archaeon]|nr:MAG: response regulator [archaeon]